MVNPISMLVDYAQAGWTWLLSLFQTGVVLDNNGNAVSIVNTDKYQWSDNMGAFLEVLAYCEGTAGRGDNDGYDVLFGYTDSNHVVFTDYSKHPHIKRPYGNTFSTAAGRYQINWGTWLGLCPKLGVSDFTPELKIGWQYCYCSNVVPINTSMLVTFLMLAVRLRVLGLLCLFLRLVSPQGIWIM